MPDGTAFAERKSVEVLGCLFDAVGSSETMVRHRLQQGRKHFAGLSSILCCSKLPLRDRLLRCYASVGMTSLWASGCWVPSVKIQRLISVQETRWLRRMLCARRRSSEDWADWLRETKMIAHERRLEYGLPALWHRVLGGIHGWAGHAMRRGQGHPANDWIRWRGALWWEFTKELGSIMRATGWRHPRQNWRPGFEQVLAGHHGPTWDALTVYRWDWKARTRAWIRHGVRLWGGPKVPSSRQWAF